MKILDILYVRYFKEDGLGLSIGGIETYMTQLSKLAERLEYRVRIFQYANFDFTRDLGYAKVYAFQYSGKHNGEFLLKKASDTRNQDNQYLTIIANDTLIPDRKVENSIAIQHGIGFDSCYEKDESLLLNFIKRQYSAYPIVKRMHNVDEVVCVDNNFICWFRTQTSFRRVKLTPILNFTAIGPTDVKKTDGVVKIVFARRFVPIRGTKLFTPVAKRLLEKYPNIEITFAGTGPDEQYIKKMLNGYDRVSYTSYKSDESIQFHSQYDISVVPTVYSEGTSLSLLEAMSAHCAVVCTNIGGMTNIILDQYNGLMVSPDEEELYDAICSLIENGEYRNQIAERAYETVATSFSLNKWEEKWTKVLQQHFNK